LRNSTLEINDPPRKRIDTSKPKLPPSRIADGSPMNPRKNRLVSASAYYFLLIFTNRYRIRQSSLGGSPDNSPQASPRSFYSARGNAASGQQVTDALIALSQTQIPGAIKVHRATVGATSRTNNYHYFTQPVNPIIVHRASRKDEQHNVLQKTHNGSTNESRKQYSSTTMNTSSAASSSNSIASTNSSQLNASTSSISSTTQGTGPWRSKISNTIKNSILGTPRFHRKSVGNGSIGTESDSECTNGSNGISDSTSELTYKLY
jgi:hypothetical protein